MPPTPQMNPGGIAAIDLALFPYRCAESTWQALDQTFNPEGPKLRLVRGRNA